MTAKRSFRILRAGTSVERINRVGVGATGLESVLVAGSLSMALMRHVETFPDLPLENMMNDERQEAHGFSPETAFSPTGGEGQPDTEPGPLETPRQTVPAPGTADSPEVPDLPQMESNDR